MFTATRVYCKAEPASGGKAMAFAFGPDMLVETDFKVDDRVCPSLESCWGCGKGNQQAHKDKQQWQPLVSLLLTLENGPMVRSSQESFEVSKVISDSYFAWLRGLSRLLTSVMTDMWVADGNGSTHRKSAKIWEQIKMLASNNWHQRYRTILSDRSSRGSAFPKGLVITPQSWYLGRLLSFSWLRSSLASARGFRILKNTFIQSTFLKDFDIYLLNPLLPWMTREHSLVDYRVQYGSLPLWFFKITLVGPTRLVNQNRSTWKNPIQWMTTLLFALAICSLFQFELKLVGPTVARTSTRKIYQ